MNCKHCYEDVPDESPFCPKCGARLDAPLLGPPEAVDPTYIDVARANLLRMRGDWDAAQASAIAVLRRYPHSPTAHSLLGDILADQGRLEEAAQWYRMALELDPGNLADQRKLLRAEETLKAAAERETAAATPKPTVSSFRVAAAAATVFLAGIIVAGFVIRGLFGSSGPSTPRVPSGPNQPAGRPPAVSVAPGATAPVAETERETFLLSTLMSRAQELDKRGLRLSAAIVDESNNRALLALNALSVDGSKPDWPRALYDGALAAANNAMAVDRDLSQVSVRVVMDLEVQRLGRRREQAFIGLLDRADVPQGGAATRFSSVWWRPGIKPPEDIAAMPASAGATGVPSSGTQATGSAPGNAQ
jgi:hypothetical protein